jgi:hypothetical protein
MRNANAFALGRKLALHASIDKQPHSRMTDIISVKSLIELCPSIPSCHEIESGSDRHFDRRIAGSLAKSLYALHAEGIIQWHCCNFKKCLKPKISCMN